MVKKQTQDLNIRKAPKFLAFLIAGSVVGLIVAFILYSLATKTTGASILGYLVVFCAGLGAGLGAIVAVVLDRVLRSKTKVVKAEVSR
ncbi:MAG: hypothetical protein ORN27_09140 [Rhodoluna sp.]|nr:hypothetical protein [Rhodoluna sp.]